MIFGKALIAAATLACALTGAARAQQAETPRTVVIAPLSSTTARPEAARSPGRGPVTNLPLPRFVSLKGSEGNARRGPALSHRVDWVFRHAGMPLRVTAEYGQWRRVEDRDGAGGWVHYSLLSGVRTAVVEADMAELRTRPDQNAAVSARAEAGAVLKLDRCAGEWCDVTGGGVSGWLPRSALWGAEAVAE